MSYIWSISGACVSLLHKEIPSNTRVFSNFLAIFSSYIQASPFASQGVRQSCPDTRTQNLVYSGMKLVDSWCPVMIRLMAFKILWLLLTNPFSSPYFSHLEGSIIRPSAWKHCLQEGAKHRPGIHA